MRKVAALLAVLMLVGWLPTAQAVTCSAFPYTLTNGTTADANQVMADFNNLNNCIANNVFNGFSNMAVFTSTGTWTVPANVTKALVYVTGGGGGSGGQSINGCATGAGGGGATNIGVLTGLTGSYTITIGAGGAAGTSAPGNGGVGGTSSFGVLMTASGGNGGFGCSSQGAGIDAGTGGNTFVGGQLNINGSDGAVGMSFPTTPIVAIAGHGGASFWGGSSRESGGGIGGSAAFGTGGAGNFGTIHAGEAGNAGVVVILY